MAKTLRLDQLVAQRHPEFSRRQAHEAIVGGKVAVDGKICCKPGTKVDPACELEVTAASPRYVSRAGYKLEKALDEFAVTIKDAVVLDAGLSTGGFADCLLQRGAARVYGVDVGRNQVNASLRGNPRLIVLEQTNLRMLTSLPELVDVVTLDLSFISLLKVLPAIAALAKLRSTIIALIKPQFEAEKGEVSRSGLVTDPRVHQRVIKQIKAGMKEHGFACHGIIESPLLGARGGNKEFLGVFVRD